MKMLLFAIALMLTLLVGAASAADLSGQTKAATPNVPLLPALEDFAGKACYSGIDPAPGRNTTIVVGTCPTPPIVPCTGDRILTTQLSTRYDGMAGSVKTMDVTKLVNILGYYDWNLQPTTWPFKQGYTIFWGFPKRPGAYVAAEFTIPMNVHPAQYGTLWTLETMPGPGVDFALSKQCGDFSPEAQFCARSNVTVGQTFARYKVPTSAVNAACVQAPGETWYMMVRLHDPANATRNCTNTTCKFGMQNNHNP